VVLLIAGKSGTTQLIDELLAARVTRGQEVVRVTLDEVEALTAAVRREKQARALLWKLRSGDVVVVTLPAPAVGVAVIVTLRRVVAASDQLSSATAAPHASRASHGASSSRCLDTALVLVLCASLRPGRHDE
jgi:hypothetical protein